MVNANSPTRQARLKAWLLLHNIEQKDLAEQMGVSQQLLSMTLTGTRATKERLEQLIDLGIPRNLLPELQEKKKTGPKYKNHITSSEKKS